MSLSIIAVLVASVGFGFANAGSKWFTQQFRSTSINVAAAYCLAIPIFIIYCISFGWPQVNLTTWGIFLLELVILFCANYCFIKALHYGDISLVIPFVSMTPIFAIFTSQALLHEQPNLRTLLGIIIVSLAGTILFHPSHGKHYKKAIAFSLGAAIIWSISAPMDKLLLQQFSLWQFIFANTAGIALCFLPLAIWRHPAEVKQLILRYPLQTAAYSLINIASIGLQMYAIQYLLVAYVNAIKRGGMLAGSIVFGKFWFKEILTWRKLVAIGIVAVGTIILLWY